MGRVWECSWDYIEKRFLPTQEKYVHINRKLERDKAVSCELCLTIETISNIRQALDKRNNLMEKKVDIDLFTKLQPAHLIELPSPRQQPEKLQYVLERLNDGGPITVERICELKKEYEKANTPPLPSGEFDVIYADPPWEYEFSLSERGKPEKYYPTMSVEEICALKVPSAGDAVLFLWATNPKLKEALQVVEVWGFEYRTNMVWVKDKFGTGYYFRGQHELLLVGKKGDMPIPSEENRPPSVLTAPVREHSEKPLEIYEMIEKMYPARKYLELFARVKRQGWESWGNETKA